MPIMPAFGRQRQGAQAFRVIFSYMVNLRDGSQKIVREQNLHMEARCGLHTLSSRTKEQKARNSSSGPAWAT